MLDLSFYYLPSQEQVFFPLEQKRFTVVTKGRRAGLTQGAAQAFMEKSLSEKKIRILWGETIYSNVQRYVDLYFMPTLNRLPQSMWSWHSKLMQLNILDTVIDFRSADTPENWEGFGYHVIFLNEAGIIMRNPDLYKKTVLPMMLDYKDSQLIAAGVPKGKKLKNGDPHPFFELWERAAKDPTCVRHNFPSRSNTFLNAENLIEIESVLDPKMRLQEIEGEFIDQTDNPYLYEFDVQRHVVDSYEVLNSAPIWLALDFNVSPNTCLVGQAPDPYSFCIFDEISINGGTADVCKVVRQRYSHFLDRGMVFVAGDATGNSRNSISGELTNYILIKKELGIRDSQLKVKRVNTPLDSSRAICNGILNKLEVTVTKNCTQTIIDCQLAEVDAGGNLIKTTGLHKFDAFRYALEARYPDFLKYAEKYIRPKQKVVADQKSLLTSHLNKK